MCVCEGCECVCEGCECVCVCVRVQESHARVVVGVGKVSHLET